MNQNTSSAVMQQRNEASRMGWGLHMTLGYSSTEPETCTCCSRPAIPVAAIPKAGDANGYFVCAFCSLTLAFKVSAMKPNQLHDIEHGAIETAVKQNIQPILTAVLAGLWGHGVRDLQLVDNNSFGEMCIAISDSPEFNKAIKQTFLDYTHAVRLEVTNYK